MLPNTMARPAPLPALASASSRCSSLRLMLPTLSRAAFTHTAGSILAARRLEMARSWLSLRTCSSRNGSALRRPSKSSLPMLSSRASVAARTVAVRVPPLSSAISPNAWPASSVAST